MAQNGVARRSIIKGLPWLLTAGATGTGTEFLTACSAGQSAGNPSTSSTSASLVTASSGREELTGAQLLERILVAVAAAPTAQITVTEAGANGGPPALMASGAVNYPKSGPVQGHLRVVTDDPSLLTQKPPMDVLVVGDQLYQRVSGRWKPPVKTTTANDPQGSDSATLDQKLRTAVQPLGQAAGIAAAKFVRVTADPKAAVVQWTASLSTRDWLSSLPPIVQGRYQGILEFELLLYLDKAGRPLQRLDTIVTSLMSVTLVTNWHAWGTKAQIPRI